MGITDLTFQAMSCAAKKAGVLPYSPGTDTFLEDLIRNADRVIYFEGGTKVVPKLIQKLICLLSKARE